MENLIDLSLDNAWDEGVHVESISDALILCIRNRGVVDINYISRITGEDPSTVVTALKGSIFQNPLYWHEDPYAGFESSDEYLSGNVRIKLETAWLANITYNGRFEANIKALSKLVKSTTKYTNIYVTLGSPWVPESIIDEFIIFLLGVPDENVSRRQDMLTKHDKITGIWEIPNKNRYKRSIAVTYSYGTARIEALDIIEDTLNMKPVKVYDAAISKRNNSGIMYVVNRKETAAALEKQKAIIQAFQDWIWTDPARRNRLEQIYDKKYGCIVRRVYDGSFLTFPGMSPEIHLYPYQKNAVARMILSYNTLLAHNVGSGKTYEMIAAGQELRRMGLSKKNMYVVPNNITGQWEAVFKQMYPDANLLIVDPQHFKPAVREAVLKDIKDADYDGVIIAYSCFDMIPLSREYHINLLKEQIRDIENELAIGKKTRSLEVRLNKLKRDLIKARSDSEDKDGSVFFEDLGINRLFVDEAHNYKNVPVETKIGSMHGLNTTGSKKCKSMLEKVHFIQRSNGGKGVVMATGTPITNSITDVYVMQLYLQSGELSLYDIKNFDSWAGMFAERVSDFEIDIDTNSYRLATRFSKFHNLPELTTILSSIADFHSLDVESGIPTHEGYIDTVLSPSDEFKKYLDDISKRADEVRGGIVGRDVDNLLKITTDGRKAALDMRLVDSESVFTFDSKVAKCAQNVRDIYYRTTNARSTQLVFCDYSTPKAGFNLYDELRALLVLYGIPPKEIEFIHDASTTAKRSSLFEKMRNGEVRILIGSTAKLGLGVNIQDRLIAIHHLDVPWRPADMTQREGRILRQGNMNSEVYLYRYIMKGSFDAYSWQLLEIKQRFISSLLSGFLTERSSSDIEDTILDYAEVKALALGNSLVKKRVEAANELSRLCIIRNKQIEARLNLERELIEIPAKITYQLKLISECENDMRYSVWRNSTHKDNDRDERKKIRELIDEALHNNVNRNAERYLTKYRGFDIVLPSFMMPDKPYVRLIREGRYSVDLGESASGNLSRIDNYINSLSQHLTELKKVHENLSQRQIAIRKELDKEDDYSDKIEYYSGLVKEIDDKLGVIRQEAV